MSQVNNVKHVLVIDYTGGSAPTAGELASTITIPVGQGAVVASRNKNTILSNSTVTSHRYVKIAYHSPSTGKLVFSPEIDAMNVDTYKGYIAAIEKEQITYVGYNGSTGTLPTSNSTWYNISIMLNGETGADFNTFEYKHVTHYSSTSTTQASVAKGLIESFASQFKFKRYPQLKAELISDGSVTAFAGGAGIKNISVVKGSDIATFATAHGLSSGTWIKIAGVNYYIYSVPSTTTVQLSIPYQGETCTIISTGATTAVTATIGGGTGTTTATNVTLSTAHGITAGVFCKIYLAGTLYNCIAGGTTPTTDITLYTAITDTANVSIAGNGYFATVPTNWGIKFTGNEKEWALAKFPYSKTTFTVSLNTSFGTTLVTESQAASRGRGVGKSVAEDEAKCQGEEYFYRYEPNIPSVSFRKDADSTKLYSQLYIKWYSYKDNENGTQIRLPKELTIYAESSQDKYDTLAAGNVDACMIDDTTGIVDVLDVLFVTTYGKGTAQNGNI